MFASTVTATAEQVVFETPFSTQTVTATGGAGAKVKRDTSPDPMVTARAVGGSIERAFNMMRNRIAGNETDANSMSTSFSSACQCHGYGGPTETVTFTHEPTV